MSYNYQGGIEYSTQHSALKAGPTQSNGNAVQSSIYKIQGTGITTNSVGGQCAETTTLPGYKYQGNTVDNMPSVISTYTSNGSGNAPSWANKCSVIMVGGGAGGRSGSQGFQKNMGQAKNSQQGRRGGSGGGGGIIFIKDMPVTGSEAYQVNIGSGGVGGQYQGGASGGTAAQQGGDTQLIFTQQQVVTLNAQGGTPGNGGSTNGGGHGSNGSPGGSQIQIQGRNVGQQRNANTNQIAVDGATNNSGRNAGSRPRLVQANVAPVIVSSTQSSNGGNNINSVNALVSGYGAGGFGGAQGPSDGTPGGVDDGGTGTGGFVRIFWHNH